MELADNVLGYINIPSEIDLEKFNNIELFEIANLNSKFREVMIKFIFSKEFKPVIPMGDKFHIRKIGLPERLKNTLLQNEFEYLTDLTVVSPKELLKMKGMGKKGLSDLIKILDDFDIELSN